MIVEINGNQARALADLANGQNWILIQLEEDSVDRRDLIVGGRDDYRNPPEFYSINQNGTIFPEQKKFDPEREHQKLFEELNS